MCNLSVISTLVAKCQMNLSNHNTRKWFLIFDLTRYEMTSKQNMWIIMCDGNNVVVQEAAAEKSRIPMCLVWVHKVSTKAQGNWIINILLWWQSRIQNMYFLCDNLYGWKQQTWKFNVTEYLPCRAEFGKPYYTNSPLQYRYSTKVFKECWALKVCVQKVSRLV